jgi:hypothetical protein
MNREQVEEAISAAKKIRKLVRLLLKIKRDG